MRPSTWTKKRPAGAGRSVKAPFASVVVRKDRKVLLVDVTKLPAAFGNPPLDRLTAAETVAITIMECWPGD